MITTGKRSGFCFGVARAVKLAEEQAKNHSECYTLGPIIHNRSVVEDLESKRIRCAETLDEIPNGATVIIRSHGAPPAVYNEIKRKNLMLVDATCPDVEKIHRIAEEESGNKRRVIILGDAAHPEVTGTAGWCENPLIIKDLSELECLFEKGLISKDTPLSLVSQTTAERLNFEECVNYIKKECTNAKIFDTICNATVLRQQEASELAKKSDVMVVVGDKASANTQKLAEICSRVCQSTFLVENAGQAVLLNLPRGARVGLIAGASAPAGVIKEVSRVMSEDIIKNEELEESFEQMLEQSFKTITTGEKVSGVVTAVTPTEIHVDLGTKHAGYIPVSELSDDPAYKPEDHIKVGDTIETFVMRVNDVEGTAMLSKKRVDAVQSWEDIEAAREAHNIVEGIVVEENKGGIVVSVAGVRVFIPASQSGMPKDTPLSTMLKKKVKLYITEVNRARRRVVGNIRAAQSEDRKNRSDSVWAEIAEGKRYSGIVKSLTSYGAFVDIGGVDGMVHVSELSWKRLGQPGDMVKVGDPLEVYVMSFDKEKKKISLGAKNPDDDPWKKFIEDYSPGNVVNVMVVKLATFGAFCEIIPGVDGLIHISQISEQRIGRPGEVLTEGQRVDVKILEIDHERKKVSLSIRALSAYEESEPADEPEVPAE